MTVRGLSPRHVRALAALAQAENGTLSDDSLRAAIGTHATNVVTSLHDRGLVRRADDFFDDSDGGLWTLTSRGSVAWAAVAPKDRPPMCSKCGQLLPARSSAAVAR